MAAKKRRKAQLDRKESSVRIRLTEEQKRLFTDAATKAGLDMSGWMRSVCIREARTAKSEG